MSVNERQDNCIVRMRGLHVAKVDDLKYLGSTVQSNGECGRPEKWKRDATREEMAANGNRR